MLPAVRPRSRFGVWRRLRRSLAIEELAPTGFFARLPSRAESIQLVSSYASALPCMIHICPLYHIETLPFRLPVDRAKKGSGEHFDRSYNELLSQSGQYSRSLDDLIAANKKSGTHLSAQPFFIFNLSILLHKLFLNYCNAVASYLETLTCQSNFNLPRR